MTPTFRWVFLLALVGRAASVPRPLVVDACALLCNPGAETEFERERDPFVFPRHPKVNCKLQSANNTDDLARVIASHCLKLCTYELTIPSEVNCFALRSSLQAHIGCYCEALTPLSPNTMRLHESWRLNFLVKELATDIINTILTSPLDTLILCEIHEELFKDDPNIQELKKGANLIVDKCEEVKQTNVSTEPRTKREVPEEEPHHEEDLHSMWKEVHEETPIEEVPMDIIGDEQDKVLHEMLQDKLLHENLFPLTEDDDDDDLLAQKNESTLFDHFIADWKQVCKQMCQYERGNQFCQCQNPHLLINNLEK